ncbi:hypothetical protein [Cardinium endosymbiont of Sogatella furcifera]|uniref:hypothetical protein n=1 Tax=Cardinium endosymbiont of Sogatella furcifera TaxID=650378 RepID=UPI0013B36003|nr:hypothetical protein [Cardinium endosymbiont of Sogatella furcifera]
MNIYTHYGIGLLMWLLSLNILSSCVNTKQTLGAYVMASDLNNNVAHSGYQRSAMDNESHNLPLRFGRSAMLDDLLDNLNSYYSDFKTALTKGAKESWGGLVLAKREVLPIARRFSFGLGR